MCAFIAKRPYTVLVFMRLVLGRVSNRRDLRVQPA